MRAGLSFRVDGLAEPSTRGPWLDLLRDIFEADLTVASELNIWAEGYRAFSYMDGEVMAANVSCRPLGLMIDGARVQAGQLHAAATRPQYRRQGLFSDLMARVLEYCDDRFDRLLLYTEVPELYQRFGFRPLAEHRFRGRLGASAISEGSMECRELSLGQASDLALIGRLFEEREPVSKTFGLYGNEDIFVAQVLWHPQWRLSYNETENVLVVWNEDGAVPQLIDVVGAPMPSTMLLAAAMGIGDSNTEIEVLFPPDRLDGKFLPRPHIPEDHDTLMVRGPFPIEGTPFMLPLTAVS